MESSGIDSNEDDFVKVLEAAREGAAWALRELHEDVAGRVHRYLVVRGVPDAEDETNEVMLRALTKLDRFDGDLGSFRSWVLTIAHHRFVDVRRRAARRVHEVSQFDDSLVGGDVEQEALDRMGDVWVQALVACLPLDQQHVIMLRIAADLSVEQAATVMGRTTGATKALQRRALGGLRRMMDHEGVPR